MEKDFVIQLSSELFKVKTDIEAELQKGNKTNEKLYALISKAIEFLKEKRKGCQFQNNFQYTIIMKRNTE